MFHYVRHVNKTKDPLGYNLSIEGDTFEKMLRYFAENGYHSVHAADLLHTSLPQNPIVLTFDDGYVDFYTTAWPLLQKYHLTASEAIISGRMDGKQYMTPAQVKEINQNGIEILSHTVHHADLAKDPNQQSEIEESKKFLENLLGKKIQGLVYPSGKYNAETIRMLKKAGYSLAFTTKPGFADLAGNLFELRRIRIDNRDSLNGLIKKLRAQP